MSRLLIGILTFVILFHVLAFIGEVFLWMLPAVYEFSLRKLDVQVAASFHEQALILRTLFINQGFYNLFVALGGVIGFALIRKGRYSQGIILLAYMCAFAFGAGLVLLSTSKAYIAGVLQSFPPLIALILMCQRKMLSSR